MRSEAFKPLKGIILMVCKDYNGLVATYQDICCISVFHWDSVSISSDRMVIEVHDYA
jgi:hypothetical protein